jgi:hypothetical protein
MVRHRMLHNERKIKILRDNTGKVKNGKSKYVSKGGNTENWKFIQELNAATVASGDFFQATDGDKNYNFSKNFDLKQTGVSANGKTNLFGNTVIVDKDCNIITSHPD